NLTANYWGISALFISAGAMTCPAPLSRFQVSGSESRVNVRPETLNTNLLAVVKRTHGKRYASLWRTNRARRTLNNERNSVDLNLSRLMSKLATRANQN